MRFYFLFKLAIANASEIAIPMCGMYAGVAIFAVDARIAGMSPKSPPMQTPVYHNDFLILNFLCAIIATASGATIPGV